MFSLTSAWVFNIVSNRYDVARLHSEKLKYIFNVDSVLRLSLGLILFAMVSPALVHAETISVSIEKNSFDIDYTGTGVTVSGIESDLDAVSLLLTVDVSGLPGTLDITFDRSFFDSTFEGADDDFLILADGDEPSFTETKTTVQSRTLSIELPLGTEDVEIIGSVFGDSTLTIATDSTTDITVDTTTDTTADDTTVDTTTDTNVDDTTVDDTKTPDATVVDTTAEQTQCGPGTILKDGVCTLDERCGPGTILKDGVCTLDERCGPGTILKDGVCTLDSTPKSSETFTPGLGKGMIIGVVTAIVIAGAIGIILGLISKASKSRD